MAHTRRLSRSVNTRAGSCGVSARSSTVPSHVTHRTTDRVTHRPPALNHACTVTPTHTLSIEPLHFHALAPRPLLSRVSGGGTATSCARCRRLRDSGGARVAAHTHPLAHTHTHATGAGSLSARRPTFGSVAQSTACTARHSSDGFTSERGCAHPTPASPHAPVPHSTRPCPQVSRPAVRPVDV